MKRLDATGRLHQQDAYDSYEFLPAYIESMERPPSPTARACAVVISILVSLGFIWSFWGELDIHATAHGRLVLPNRSQLIQPYELSRVMEILVKEGQHVQAGDKLLVLKIVGAAQEISRCQEQKDFQALELARYSALLSNAPLKKLLIPKNMQEAVVARFKAHFAGTWQEHQAMLTKFDAELAINRSEQIAHRTSISCLQKLLCNIKQRLASSRKLTQSHIMSKMELLSKEKEALETQLSISTKQKEINILQARATTLKENKTSYIAQKNSAWHDALHKATSALLMAEQDLAKAQDRGRLQILSAPSDGVVQQVAVHTIGGIVQTAQTLMIVVPHDAPKQAEIDIANKDIGFVRPEQRVTVKVAAFPYNRYGTIHGKVVSLSRDSVNRHGTYTSTELVFPVQIELDQSYMMIHGNPVNLTPGMTITAEIKIGKRRVIDYLLSPIRAYTSQSCREP